MQDARSSYAQQEAHELYRSWLLANKASQKSSETSPCTDKNLYAIAHLASHTLKAQHAIISLVDHESQHILVEATRDLLLSRQPSSDHGLFLATSLSLSDILCDRRILENPTADRDRDQSDHFFSTDCELDDRFKDHAFVKKEGGIRFVVGVPLRSKNDCTVGVLVVCDDAPRENVEDLHLAELKEYAQCVMRHLELTRMAVGSPQENSILREIARGFADQYSSKSDKEKHGKSEVPKELGNKEGGECNPVIIESETEIYTAKHDTRRSIEASMQATFDLAAKILRNGARADGAVIFGPPEVADLMAVNDGTSPHESDGNADEVASIVLASCLQNEVVFPAAENQPTPSMKTLRHLASTYPCGKSINLTGHLERTIAPTRFDQHASRTGSADKHVGHTEHESQGLPAMLLEEILTSLGNALRLIFLPVYDQGTNALLAFAFAWNVAGVSRGNAHQDIEDCQILGNFLSHSIAQLRTQNKDAEQKKLMSNFSHELRTPINGILGAAQFLQDTVSTSYQIELLQSIVVSSNTLLDTLNLVLDYTKFEHAVSYIKEPFVEEKSSSALSVPAQSFYAESDVDLALLIEDATETVVAGHFFDNLPPDSESSPGATRSYDDYGAHQGIDRGTTQDVKVILQFAARPSWSVKTSPGAISRIVMNLVGNALKVTPTGTILVELDPQTDEDASKMKVRLKVTDSGIGMTEDFMKHHLFTPYRQGNPFSPGVGLGMSVLKHMVSSLDGDLSISSKEGEGTAITVDLRLTASEQSLDGVPEDIKAILSRIKGKHLVLLDPKAYDRTSADAVVQRGMAIESVATDWLGMRVSMSSDIDVADADFYLFSQPPPVNEVLKQHQKAAKNNSTNMEVPLVVVASDSRQAHLINIDHAVSLEETGRIVQVLSQPCGPRKLAKVLNLCQDRVEQSIKDRTSKERVYGTSTDHKPSESEPGTRRNQYGGAEDGQSVGKLGGPPSVSEEKRPPKKISRLPSSKAVEHQDQQTDESQRHTQSNDQTDDGECEDGDDDQNTGPQEPQLPFSKPLVLSRDPEDAPTAKQQDAEKRNLHGLCVDDNKINLRLLVTLMKKEKHSYEQAENDQEALDAFVANNGVEASSDDSRRPFDFVLMDIGMPVMNGMQCTKAIREYERKHNLTPTYIVACTAWGDMQTQREAKEAGMDAFLPKPLKFAHLKNLLAGLMKHE